LLESGLLSLFDRHGFFTISACQRCGLLWNVLTLGLLCSLLWHVLGLALLCKDLRLLDCHGRHAVALGLLPSHVLLRLSWVLRLEHGSRLTWQRQRADANDDVVAASGCRCDWHRQILLLHDDSDGGWLVINAELREKLSALRLGLGRGVSLPTIEYLGRHVRPMAASALCPRHEQGRMSTRAVVGVDLSSLPVKRHRGEPGHTRDTRDTRTHKGTQTNLTTNQTHQQQTPRTSARRPKPRPTQQPQARSRPLPAADSEEAAPSKPDPASLPGTGYAHRSAEIYENHTCAEFALNISIDTRLRAQRLLPPFRLIAGPIRVARPSALEGGTRPYEAAARHARQGASRRRGGASSCRALATALGSVAAARALESRAFDTELVHAAVAPPYAHERCRGGRRLIGAVQCSAQGGALLERAVVNQPHRL